ncbi:guanine nucleotide exchange factor C9orf72 homolog [Nematostella vectensis]|uniref:guanine nucleotide exchange factor C9orf72 homolog n=1 Tax=Nematostella vectensis TaxID=45351 RepID=UPI0020777964|nr:guanine nucleotide exchange factor C9orf72 homolog [Nematostella vectensis]
MWECSVILVATLGKNTFVFNMAGRQVDASESAALSLLTNSSDDSFAFANLSEDFVTVLADSGPFMGIVLSYWDNILGPRLRHVWRGGGEEKNQENCVKYVVSRTLNGELLRDAPENVVDTKLFVIKEKGIVCHSFIFTGRDSSGSNISALSLMLPHIDMAGYLPLVELVEDRVKILIAKLRVLQTKDLNSSLGNFSMVLPRFIQTLISLQHSSLPKDIPINNTVFSADHNVVFDPVFLRRVITSHLQTFGSTMVIGQSISRVNLMINSLALFLSSNERQKSRYAVDGADTDVYDTDLYLQGVIKDGDGNFTLPVKGVITSIYPTTLVDVDTCDVKKTYPYHEHSVIRKEFLDLELALMWEGHEGAPVYPSIGLFHPAEDIGLLVQTFINDMNVLPFAPDVRAGFVETFRRLLVRKALALIKYVEARSKRGRIALEYAAKRQLRHDLQLNTEADFGIVLACAEKHKPGLYTFLMGDPRHAVARVQTILESL